MLPIFALPVTLKIPLTLLMLPAVIFAVNTPLAVPMLPIFALPVMFAVPATFAPVDVIISTLAVPPTPAVIFPLGAATTLLDPFAKLVGIAPEPLLVQLRTPEPSVINTCPAEPSIAGNVNATPPIFPILRI